MLDVCPGLFADGYGVMGEWGGRCQRQGSVSVNLDVSVEDVVLGGLV